MSIVIYGLRWRRENEAFDRKVREEHPRRARRTASALRVKLSKSYSVLRMNFRLENKIVVVTGAGTGLGRACALGLAENGAKVTLVGRRKARLEETAHAVGGAALVVTADVARREDIDRVIAATISRFGGLNGLVNNAGILRIGNAEQITEAHWDET